MNPKRNGLPASDGGGASPAAGPLPAGSVMATSGPATISVAEQAELDRIWAALQKRRDGGKLTGGDVAAIRRYEERRAVEQRAAVLRSVPQAELVAMIDSSCKVLLQWEADGLPVARSGRSVTYDLYRVLPWLKARWLGSGEGPESSKRAAEIKLLIRREAALQLKMQIMSGQLRDRGDVDRENCAKALAVRAGLEALKRSLAPAVLELTDGATLDEAEELIWDHVEPLLRTFAGDFNRVRHSRGAMVRRRKADVEAAGQASAE